jgi:hypothetical protein
VGEIESGLTVLMGVAIPATLAIIVFLAVLGNERERMNLMVEYYKQIKYNADKERLLAAKNARVKTKARDLERDAIAVLRLHNLAQIVEPPPPPPTPPVS